MAAMAESRMNLAALQQRDPYITDIVDTASQVALYSFNPKTNEWEKTDVEGTLFVYTRSASPTNGFMILNRLGLNDLIEPLTKNLEFQLQDPFLLYRNAALSIYGIWFYDKDECARIGQLMNCLVQIAIENHEKKENVSGRQRRASESDTMVERTEGLSGMPQPQKHVDIIEMLSKAKDEYDKAKGGPKPMIDNPNAAATKSSTLIKPLAVKAGTSSPGAEAMGAEGSVEPTTPTTQISLEALFRRASLQQGATGGPPKDVHGLPKGTMPPRSTSLVDPKSAPPGGMPPMNTAANEMPPLLQRLMSNPGGTLAEIERQQQGQYTQRDQMPQPVGAEAPPVKAPATNKPAAIPNGLPRVQTSPRHKFNFSEAQSPETALKRTLNIIPQSPKQSSLGDSASRGPALLSDLPAGGATGTAPVKAQGHGVQSTAAMRTQPGASSPAASVNIDIRQGTPPVDQPAQGAVIGGDKGAGSTGTKDTSGLITPQALCQTTLTVVADGAKSNQMEAGASANSLSDSGGSMLLTPQAFVTPSSQRVTPPACTALPAPSAFQSSASVLTQSLTASLGATSQQVEPLSSQNSSDAPRISPLTRDQLQQALLHLVKNDTEFLNRVHEAYVKSLTSGLSTHKS